MTSIELRRLSFLLIFVGPLTTLIISPWTNFDPINLIKMVVVSAVGWSIFGLLISNVKSLSSSTNKFFLFSCLLFLIFLLSTFFFSGAPVSQQFWGQFGRSTGLLAYVSLIFVSLGASILGEITFHKKLVMGMFFTVVPMTLYCLIQVAGLDPIGWSSYAAFGTLGNINFLSAYFGISSVALMSLILGKEISFKLKLVFAMFVVTDLIIVGTTGSIQGIMIFIAGAGISIFFYLISSNKFKKISIPFGITGLAGFTLTVLGLSNIGPLARFIFQPSVIYRTDYWHAGWKMTIEHPIFGVGLDSYGDWYRQVRGEISTNRTDPNRISNTAHSIFLDISSNGGFPLIIAYLSIVICTLIIGIQKIRKFPQYNSYFVAIFSSWLAYQIQSLISINQIGVGIWGWILTGAVVGFPVDTNSNSGKVNIVNRKTSKKNKSHLNPLAGMLMLLGFVVGFVLAVIPLSADAKFKSANNRLDGVALIAAVKSLGSTSFHAENAMNAFIKSNLGPQAKEITDYLLSKYPRDFAGWGARAVLNSSTPEQKDEAIKKLQELDPFNRTLFVNN